LLTDVDVNLLLQERVKNRSSKPHINSDVRIAKQLANNRNLIEKQVMIEGICLGLPPTENYG